ncbi:MAG: hypothetical protein HY314_08130 [Acidobacteria bacterium]|nr:hypothetical protein [Acidobacteriota bacterium]
MREIQDIIDELKSLPIPAQLRVVGALAQNLEASLAAGPRHRLAPDGTTWVEWLGQCADLWQDENGQLIDAQEYLNKERDSWD